MSCLILLEVHVCIRQKLNNNSTTGNQALWIWTFMFQHSQKSVQSCKIIELPSIIIAVIDHFRLQKHNKQWLPLRWSFHSCQMTCLNNDKMARLMLINASRRKILFWHSEDIMMATAGLERVWDLCTRVLFYKQHQSPTTLYSTVHVILCECWSTAWTIRIGIVSLNPTVLYEKDVEERNNHTIQYVLHPTSI